MSTALEKLKSLKEQLEKEESGGALKPPFPTLFLHNNPDPDSGLEFGKFYVGEKGDGEWIHLQHFIPVLEKVRPIDIPEAEKVLEGSKAIEVFQEWVDRYNSRMVKQETASEEDLEPSNVPFDEDDELELDI